MIAQLKELFIYLNGKINSKTELFLSKFTLNKYLI
jgi:hypothetical protein